jgi:hypothetical protein
MSENPKAKTTVTRVLGVIGGLALGALVGAIAMGIATLAADWQGYAGYVPTPTLGGLGGGAIGVPAGTPLPGEVRLRLRVAPRQLSGALRVFC